MTPSPGSAPATPIVASDDDFGVNSAGIMITETTITQFEGWDPNGKPEFMRSRKALQYANGIDDYVRIIKEGNNGGYANDVAPEAMGEFGTVSFRTYGLKVAFASMYLERLLDGQ